MSKEYATLKNLVRAIRNLESKPPRSPIKGYNHSRHETSLILYLNKKQEAT